MVTANRTRQSDRGQLLLIGAISLAFILLGVVVVFNGVQYTETINSGSASEDMQEIRTVESEIQTGLETIDDERGTTQTKVTTYIKDVYGPEKAQQGPVHISVINVTSNSVTIRYTTDDVTVERQVSWP